MSISKSQHLLLGQRSSGVLPLNIETGRYVTQRVEDQICKLCGNGAMEDKEYFIYHCPKCVNLRAQIYSHIHNANCFIKSLYTNGVFQDMNVKELKFIAISTMPIAS